MQPFKECYFFISPVLHREDKQTFKAVIISAWNGCTRVDLREPLVGAARSETRSSTQTLAGSVVFRHNTATGWRSFRYESGCRKVLAYGTTIVTVRSDKMGSTSKYLYLRSKEASEVSSFQTRLANFLFVESQIFDQDPRSLVFYQKLDA